MRMFKVSSAAALCALAGHASAQIVVDGQLDAAYGFARWVQNNPTGFGDNVPVPFDTASVATGIEVRIPAAVLNGATTVQLTAFVNAGCNCFLSNQVIGGLSGQLGNLGGPGGVNFQNLAGSQTVTFNINALPDFIPTLDGQRDASYGSALSLQANFTQFGNSTAGTVTGGGGSELDNLHAAYDQTNDELVLFFGGNLEANGNSLDIFLDTGTGGDTTLQSGGVYGQGRINNMAGLTFESALNGADFYIGINGNGNDIFVDAGVVASGGAGWYVGSSQGYGTPIGFTPGDSGAPLIIAAIDNSNVAGVGSSPPQASQDFASGSEFDNVYARKLGRYLYVFVGGNLESSYNKADFFLDVAPGGQRTINAFNVDIDFNGINNMGTGADGYGCPGLTFDDSLDYGPFEADYWLAYGTNGTDAFANASVLRTDGALRGSFGEALDYGMFDGGSKALNDPITCDGLDDAGNELLDPFGATNIFTRYAPRTPGLFLINGQPPIGTPDLIHMTIDNSNIEGVTGDSVINPAEVTTGIEFFIALDEAGWKPNNPFSEPYPPIKLAGVINSSNHQFMSNQVLNGLPDGFGNLGTTCAVDFSAIDGDQFIVICPSDVDGSGFVDTDDFDYFVNIFDQGLDEADFDASGFVDTDDFDAFVRTFENGC